MTDLPYLVAGGGIAGLAAAIGLSRLGPVRLFEQAAAFEEVGAGLQMSPNGVRALQALGAWDAVQPSCVVPAEIHVRDGRTGRVLQRIDLGRDFQTRFGAPYRVCHRADLLAGLVETASGIPAIELSTGRRVIAASDHTPEIHLDGGATAAGRAIIGADGIRSAVRDAVCGKIAPADRGLTIFRALVPMASVPSEIEADCVTLWLCPGGHAVHYPVSNWRAFNIVAVSERESRDSGWGVAASSRTVAECFPEAAEPLSDILRAPMNWLRWQGADLPQLPRWSKGNMVLVGDAAHATLPFLAQGAVMSLEDACVLRETIARSGTLAAAFKRYEAVRKPRATRIQAQSRRMGGIYHLAGLAARARNLALRFSGPAAALRRTAWIYDWKPE